MGDVNGGRQFTFGMEGKMVDDGGLGRARAKGGKSTRIIVAWAPDDGSA